MRFKRLTVLWRFQYKVFVLVFTAGQYFFSFLILPVYRSVILP
jgi:hypothetical protein